MVSGSTTRANPIKLGQSQVSHNQSPVAIAQAQAMRCPPQCDIELMPQEKILDLEPLPRLDQVGDKDSEQMEDCEHRAGSCSEFYLVSRIDRIGFSGTTMGMTVVERHEDDLVAAPALGAPSLSNDDAVKDSDQRRVGLKAEHDAAIHLHVGLQIEQAVHIDRMQIAPGASQRTCVRNPGTTAC